MTTETQAGLNQVSVSLEHKEATFNFRAKKDADGKETKRAPITLSKIPVPNLNGVIAIIKAGAAETATAEDKRSLEFLLEIVGETVLAGARDVINADEAITSDANFPYEKLVWSELSKVTTQERRSSAIPQEVWDAFIADWGTVFSARGMSQDNIKKQASVLRARFSPIRAVKAYLENFKKGMAIYVQATEKLEDFQEIVSLLNNKLDELLKVDVAADTTFQF